MVDIRQVTPRQITAINVSRRTARPTFPSSAANKAPNEVFGRSGEGMGFLRLEEDGNGFGKAETGDLADRRARRGDCGDQLRLRRGADQPLRLARTALAAEQNGLKRRRRVPAL